MELLLIRHALPIRIENTDGRPADPPLSALGHLQKLNQLTLFLSRCSQLSEDSARTQLKGLIDLHPNAVDASSTTLESDEGSTTLESDEL